MSRWKRTLIYAAVPVVVVYFGIVGWYYVKEDSFLYFPRQGLRSAEEFDMNIKTVEFPASDGVQLVGWIVPSLMPDTSQFWVLYFHGNGGNISSRGYVAHYRALRNLGLNVFAIDYRGYGLSEGSPSEQGLYLDGRAAFDYLVNQRHISPRRIIIFGYSLGAAVAIHLATEVAAAGLIVEGAFTSAVDVGRERYPFFPINWMMKSRFDSESRMHAVAEPSLFLHAVRDEIIPFEFGRRLFDAAREPKFFVETAGGHNTAHTADSAKFYSSIADFIRQLTLPGNND
ncbi:MAG: alpha/beta hydrolase [Bacteroidetes bacterium]|nr:alpha/beta hydrolase [Bacteroidota bacterium]MCW5894288.1 alpha/beta hydrolase [Bacteroidota bacterium]